MSSQVVSIRSYMDKKDRWNKLLKAWRDWLIAGVVSRETLRLRTYHMRRFALDHSKIKPFDLDADDLTKWLAGHQWSAETMHSYRSSLRSFYGWAHASGHNDTDPSRLLRSIKRRPGKARPAPEPVIDTALEIGDSRDWLIIMLGSRQGLRRGEISRGHSDDLIDNGGGRWSLRVLGKGDKIRIVPLLGEVARALRQLESGWFFPNGLGSHLTPAHVGVLAGRAMHRGATLHQLRHRFGVVTYKRTKDIRAVQELLGHASVSTTQIYTEVDNDTLRAVMETAA